MYRISLVMPREMFRLSRGNDSHRSDGPEPPEEQATVVQQSHGEEPREVYIRCQIWPHVQPVLEEEPTGDREHPSAVKKISTEDFKVRHHPVGLIRLFTCVCGTLYRMTSTNRSKRGSYSANWICGTS